MARCTRKAIEVINDTIRDTKIYGLPHMCEARVEDGKLRDSGKSIKIVGVARLFRLFFANHCVNFHRSRHSRIRHENDLRARGAPRRSTRASRRERESEKRCDEFSKKRENEEERRGRKKREIGEEKKITVRSTIPSPGWLGPCAGEKASGHRGYAAAPPHGLPRG